MDSDKKNEIDSNGLQPKNEPIKKEKKPRKKWSRTKKIIVSLVSFFLIIILAVFGYAMILFGMINYQPGTQNSQVSSPTSIVPASTSDYFNILLIGSDSRTEGDQGRSDSMILLTIDQKHKKLKMTSLMRDIYINIPGHNDNKLNAAYAFGGADLLLQTVRDGFAVDVSHYMVIDFEMFKKAVDRIGGVTIDLTQSEVNHLRTSQGITGLVAGENKLDGTAALAYSRIRNLAGDDFRRTERQRTVLEAIIKGSKDLNLLEMNGLLQDILPSIQTNMSQMDVMGKAVEALTFKNYPVSEFRIPADNTWKNGTKDGMSVLEIDFKENSRLLQEFIYETGVK